ncbi:DUF1311 domain-containing protein [Pontibacter qinzhouensis]|uniref:DUF1311 domain-containing protein n=1 Tax=Pontibacter qinzhouensis TaxID=2603253 RepID=A0A5C8KEY1_9BACT|nr:lysozyme inhibitor LprI family protein [Pontibacter qinzhouensis]TXK51864.1 DUF1311 domain-containing protein [Pontibacter qinzhouensis]
MIQTRRALFLGFFIIFTFSTRAQTVTEFNGIDRHYQTCLDKGSNMLNCFQGYYYQMDSLLNVVYNNLRHPLNLLEKAALKKEQLNWLARRDAYFKEVDTALAAENKDGFAGSDSRMIAFDDKARFVRKRVEELLIKLAESQKHQSK